MSRQINNPVSTRYLRRDGRRDALQRLDEHLEHTTTSSNSEIIRLMRQAMFADVDELEKSGQVIVPNENTMTGKRKIARLPRGIRDQLNRRLDEGEAGNVSSDS